MLGGYSVLLFKELVEQEAQGHLLPSIIVHYYNHQFINKLKANYCQINSGIELFLILFPTISFKGCIFLKLFLIEVRGYEFHGEVSPAR